jgi:hypothetical protein
VIAAAVLASRKQDSSVIRSISLREGTGKICKWDASAPPATLWRQPKHGALVGVEVPPIPCVQSSNADLTAAVEVVPTRRSPGALGPGNFAMLGFLEQCSPMRLLPRRSHSVAPEEAIIEFGKQLEGNIMIPWRYERLYTCAQC